MNTTSWRLRRLILGMSIDDAQSKFDSPQSRSAIRVAHERHNQGILHELLLAQQQRNRMPSEKKCHISRYAKPSVKGFQGYLKETPDDYVVVELWETPPGHAEKRQSNDNSLTTSPPSPSPTTAICPKIMAEKASFCRAKETVLESLRDALDNVKNNVLMELTDRRQSGALIGGGQPSVVERLVGEVSESYERGFKSLSSSSHLLEPVEMELTLFAKKDKEIADAFRSPLLSFPAREGDISYSLWVAGGLIADEETSTEFPYHIAKYVVVDNADSANANRLPRVDVEVYFSPELYQLQHAIGKSGIVALRKFVGGTMMRQHEPTPQSASLLLNASQSENELLNVFNPSGAEAIRIPWVRKTRSVLSTATGVALRVEDAVEESATIEKMKDSVSLVWRAWGHLIKDFHVHGDLDYLYVSVDRRKEVAENDSYIEEVRQQEESARKDPGDKSLAVYDGGNAIARDTRTAQRHHRLPNAPKKETFYCPVPANFTVVECILERKGLPHNMVIEDITEILTEMQTQALDMMRLAVVEETGEDSSERAVVPVLYAPKVVVSHAGVIENRTHSFQRIRIRGSTLAHVEALIASLSDGDYFTSRTDSKSPSEQNALGEAPVPLASSSLPQLPKNLSFSATHAPQTAALLRRGRGHQSLSEGNDSRSSLPRRGLGGRFRRHQLDQKLDFMTVTDEEREFWKTHFYRLSDPKVLFQDRVDISDLDLGADSASARKPTPRLLEHLTIVNGKLTDGGNGGGGSESGGAGKGKRGKRRQPKKKMLDVTQIPRDKMFEYYCTDTEAETSQYDLRVGDCLGYAYKVNLRRIPAKQVELVPPAVQSVAAKGFINYFGPNRFATYTKMNMHPGLHLLKGEFRAAAHVIVQQFYIDAAMEAERKRTGAAFPQPFGLKGSLGFHLNDFSKRGGGGRRSVAEHGTAMQRVLSNALQAMLLMASAGGDEDAALEQSVGNIDLAPPPTRRELASFTDMIETDPCADAFLNVVGPNACHILIHEFLAFVWNDIVNQRIQRYGTFAILPGDLVRKQPLAPRGSAGYGELTRVTRREIQTGQRTHWDVVLPIPGANMLLPDNHTADLYIVTLKRMGLLFDPEERQWECFYPRLWQHQHASPPTAARRGPGSSNGSDISDSSSSSHGGGGVPLNSPYRFLSSSYQLIEEELGYQTPFTEPLPRYLSSSSPPPAATSSSSSGEEILFDPEADSLASALTGSSRVGGTSVFDAGGLRPDLQRQQGNPLNLLVEASYRQPLFCPRESLRWQFNKGTTGDPHQRWGMRRQHGDSSGGGLRTHLVSSGGSASAASSSSAELRRMAALPVGTYIPGDGERRLPQLVLPNSSGGGASSTSSFSSSTRSTGHAGTLACLPRPHIKAPLAPSRWRDRRLPIPAVPYWLPQHNDACLTLDFELPTGVYPAMLLRELTKLDVNTPEIVDVDRPPLISTADGRSWSALPTDKQELYRKYLTKRRQRGFVAERPQAVSLALLHQQIFRSGGVRGSLIPSLRSYDSVSK